MKCDSSLSSLYCSSYGVPQRSVFGPLLFIMYTTPSILSSPLSLNYHLYADDTNSFSPFTHPTRKGWLKMAGAWFLHWPVHLVRDLYRPYSIRLLKTKSITGCTGNILMYRLWVKCGPAGC